MTMTTPDLEAFNDAHADKLGRVAWFAVTTPDTPTLRSDLEALLAAEALEQFLPSERSEPDIFRDVTSGLKRTVDMPDGSTIILTVRDVSTHDKEIVRRVVAEHRNSKKQRLSYDQTWDIRYDKEHRKIELFPIYADADGRISPRDRFADPLPGDDIVSTVKTDFHANIGTVSPSGLRGMVNRIMTAGKAVSVRPNGIIYFFPGEHDHLAVALTRLAKVVPGLTFRSVVLPADEDGRDMVLTGIQCDTVEAVDALISEMRKAKAEGAGGEISQRRLATFKGERDALRERLEAYQDLLADELTDADTRLTMLDGVFASMVR